jgi:N-acetylneuraminic acid mutarotase
MANSSKQQFNTGTDSGGVSYSLNKPLIECTTPSGRGGTSCVFANGKLVVFGGHYFSGGDSFEYLNETWLLDIESLEWHKINCSGDIPGPRYAHTAHILGSRMFIFGGKGPKDTLYKDCYFLDLIEWVWVPVKAISATPAPRFFHASEVVGKKIVLHGGWDGTEIFNDLWIFNTENFAWIQPKTTGFGPTDRYGHSLTLTADGRLLIFGGATIDKATGVPKYLDDLRQLDTETMIWTRPRISGPVPTARYSHSASQMSDGKLAIFGGWGKSGCQNNELIKDARAFSIHVLDTSTMTWFIPRKLGHKPIKHLYGHGTCNASGSTLFIHGGFDGRQALGDFYVLNFEFQHF